MPALELPDPLTAEDLSSRLRTRSFGRIVQIHSSLPSTQATAAEAALAGAPEGTLFVAESQTQGRGRHGHRWDSPAGAGLYASLVLRPTLDAVQATLLTLAYGLAIADAVAETTSLQPELRWPNDLLLGGKKFCGLLLDMHAPRIDYAVLGFGINVRPRSFPPELQAIATALDLHTSTPTSRPILLAAVLEQLEARTGQFLARPPAQLLAEVEARCPRLRGAAVVVGNEAGAPWTGTTAGLDALGFLQILTPGGVLRRVLSGDVRPAPAE